MSLKRERQLNNEQWTAIHDLNWAFFECDSTSLDLLSSCENTFSKNLNGAFKKIET